MPKTKTKTPTIKSLFDQAYDNVESRLRAASKIANSYGDATLGVSHVLDMLKAECKRVQDQANWKEAQARRAVDPKTRIFDATAEIWTALIDAGVNGDLVADTEIRIRELALATLEPQPTPVADTTESQTPTSAAE